MELVKFLEPVEEFDQLRYEILNIVYELYFVLIFLEPKGMSFQDRKCKHIGSNFRNNTFIINIF